jgi:hypothetical protein
MNTNDFKAQARAQWHASIQNRVGPLPPPPSEAMQRWVELQWALARYSPTFHGGLMAGYNTSGPAFAAVVKALELGYQAASGPSTRTPIFRGV